MKKIRCKNRDECKNTNCILYNPTSPENIHPTCNMCLIIDHEISIEIINENNENNYLH